MARSSSRYSSSSSRCFSEYWGWDMYSSANYACTIIFTLVFLGILVMFCVLRRKTGPGKRLIGLPYILALALWFIISVMQFIQTTLTACRIGINTLEFIYDWAIAMRVLSTINQFLFLFVFVYVLNGMLRKRLGHFPSVLKVTLASLLAVIYVLLAVVTILISIVYYKTSRDDYGYYYDITTIALAAAWMGLAVDILVTLCVLGSGGLAISAARSLTKRHGANKSLLIWIAVLVACVVGTQAISIYSSVLSLPLPVRYGYDYASNVATYWISSFFAAISYIAFILIAKNAVWRSQKSDSDHVAVEQGYYGNEYAQPPTAHGGAGYHA